MTYLYILLAILAVCFPLSFYLESVYAKSYTWHIKKGAHYCSLWQRFLFWIFWLFRWKFNAKSMEYTVQFNESMKYDHKNGNQFDWNKLPGFQKGFDKTNRRLHGWRWNTEDRQFNNSWYIHKNNTEPEYENEGYEMWSLPGDNVPFYVEHPFSFSAPLFVYFGGDEVAPDDMDITITGMVVK